MAIQVMGLTVNCYIQRKDELIPVEKLSREDFAAWQQRAVKRMERALNDHYQNCPLEEWIEFATQMPYEEWERKQAEKPAAEQKEEKVAG